MQKSRFDFLQKLLTFFLINIAVMMISLVIGITFKIPVIGELVSRFADKDKLNTLLYAIYAVSYYAILALLVFKNSSARRAFLNATAEEGYSAENEALRYIRDNLVSDLTAIALISVAAYLLIGIFFESAIIKTVFLPQYAIAELFSLKLASMIFAAFTLVYNFAVTLLAQYIWNKNRLGKTKQD